MACTPRSSLQRHPDHRTRQPVNGAIALPAVTTHISDGNYSKPAIAVSNGDCFAGPLAFAHMCDIGLDLLLEPFKGANSSDADHGATSKGSKE